MSDLPDLDDQTIHDNETIDEDVNSLTNITAEPVEISEGIGNYSDSGSGSDGGSDSDVEITEESEFSTSKDQPEFMKENTISGKLEETEEKRVVSTHQKQSIAGQPESDESEDEDEDEGGDSFKKLEAKLHRDILLKYHPEIEQQNYSEILALCKLSRDITGSIVDPLHRTLPFLSKYERARVLGMRTKQLNTGSAAFVDIPADVIDGLIIARLELAQGKIPFIIRRPLPNGQSEYWKLTDLEDIYY